MGIETALVGFGIASNIYGGIKAGKQAKKARKKQKRANKASKEALATAREDLDINFYDSLSINIDPYNQERDAMLSASANIIDSAVQADQRGIGASAQSILAASQKSQQSITKRLNKELENVELLKASEDARLRDEMAKTYLTEAKGSAQAAQAYAEQAAESRLQQAKSFSSAGQQALKHGVGLYQGGEPDVQINNVVTADSLGDDVIDTIPDDWNNDPWNDPTLGGDGNFEYV
jgi:hypothetical protein